MSSPIIKRFLLSVPIICLLYLLLSKISQGPAAIHPFKRFHKSQEPVRVLIKHPSINESDLRHSPPPLPAQHTDAEGLLDAGFIDPVEASKIKASRALIDLTQCPRSPNQFTSHIRLPNLLYNVSMSPRSVTTEETRSFWNPTIFALPYVSSLFLCPISRAFCFTGRESETCSRLSSTQIMLLIRCSGQRTSTLSSIWSLLVVSHIAETCSVKPASAIPCLRSLTTHVRRLAQTMISKFLALTEDYDVLPHQSRWTFLQPLLKGVMGLNSSSPIFRAFMIQDCSTPVEESLS
jgi:hypothetical protein